MAINERHEQLNRNIGKEGIVGLTEDNNKFHRWLLCTQEVTRVIAEFEAQTSLKTTSITRIFNTMKILRRFITISEIC